MGTVYPHPIEPSLRPRPGLLQSAAWTEAAGQISGCQARALDPYQARALAPAASDSSGQAEVICAPLSDLNPKLVVICEPLYGHGCATLQRQIRAAPCSFICIEDDNHGTDCHDCWKGERVGLERLR